MRLERGEMERDYDFAKLENADPTSNSVRLEWILKGVPNMSFHLNVSLFDCVQSYILETNRFTL